MTSKERAAFRAAANGLDPVFQIGKGGVTDARELIKVRALLETIPQSPKEMAQTIAERTGAEIVQVIGGVIVLYRENPELRQAEKEKEKRKKEAAKKKREQERMLQFQRKSGRNPANRHNKQEKFT